MAGTDAIIVKGARFSCNIGITDAEREKKQPLIIDIRAESDTSKAAKSKRLEDTINYSALHAETKKLIEGKEFILSIIKKGF